MAETTTVLPPDGTGDALRMLTNAAVAGGALQQVATLATALGVLIGHAEDAAHASGDGGIMALGVRNDGGASLSGADGDYTPLAVDATGRLFVDTELPVAAAMDDATAGPTVPGVASFLMGFNGTNWARLRAGADNADAVASTTTTSRLMALARAFVYNGTAWDRLRVPAVFKTATATASGNTALWTPTSGKKFRLQRVLLGVSADAATTSGARITVKLQDSTTDLPVSVQVFVPAVAGTTFGNGFVTPWIDLGNGPLSAAANNVLNVNLSAALSTGAAFAIACGTEE